MTPVWVSSGLELLEAQSKPQDASCLPALQVTDIQRTSPTTPVEMGTAGTHPPTVEPQENHPTVELQENHPTVEPPYSRTTGEPPYSRTILQENPPTGEPQ